jgi:hypothetical protein
LIPLNTCTPPNDLYNSLTIITFLQLSLENSKQFGEREIHQEIDRRNGDERLERPVCHAAYDIASPGKVGHAYDGHYGGTFEQGYELVAKGRQYILDRLGENNVNYRSRPNSYYILEWP